MKQWQMDEVMNKAEIVLKERGYTAIERRSESGEFSPLTYIVATNESGKKAEAYPRNTRDGMTYVIHED